VLEQYPRKVKLIFKNYPLSQHQVSVKAAVAALAAERQGKFWEFHDLLFDRVNELDEDAIWDIAEDLGLDEDQLEHDMRDPRILLLINRDLQEGSRIGVMETPTLYINGSLQNTLSLEEFQAVIGRELAKLAKSSHGIASEN
jgi:protein-disulfide isomerase